MTDQELCALFESLAALIETNNADRALTILHNAISRIYPSAPDTEKADKKETDKPTN